MHSEFAVHRLNEVGILAAKHIAEIFDKALTELEVVCMDSREFSIAKTKLEEACFFAKKAMCLNLNNQVVDEPVFPTVS